MTPRTDHSPADPAAHSPGDSDRLRTALHSGDGPGSVVINTLSLPVDVHALGAEGDAPKPVRIEVIPPPGAGGVLPAADGRVQRVRDPAALAAALNAQAHAARIDRDHRSEPSAQTFAGTTEAEGWLSNFSLNHRGGISADADLDDALVKVLRAKRYRYISPALLLDADDVVGLSSIGFVNNPNLAIESPRINSGVDMNADELKTLKNDLDARETKLAEREAAATKLLENAAERAVDAAIGAHTILPAQKDYHLTAIKTHTGGIDQGIAAFNAFVSAGADSAAQDVSKVLTQRIAPRGQPPTGRGDQAPAFTPPSGWAPPSDERTALHARIAAHATERGISYRQAIVELGATGA